MMTGAEMGQAVEWSHAILHGDALFGVDMKLLARALLASREELEQEIARRQRLFEDYERTTLALVESQEDAEKCRAQLRDAENRLRMRFGPPFDPPSFELVYHSGRCQWMCVQRPECRRAWYASTPEEALRNARTALREEAQAHAALADAAPPQEVTKNGDD